MDCLLLRDGAVFGEVNEGSDGEDQNVEVAFCVSIRGAGSCCWWVVKKFKAMDDFGQDVADGVFLDKGCLYVGGLVRDVGAQPVGDPFGVGWNLPLFCKDGWQSSHRLNTTVWPAPSC